MPKNNLEDLRKHLFETIERLKDETKPMEVDRARAVADVARTILESAKVEIGYMKATGAASESDFIAPLDQQRLPKKQQPALPPPVNPQPAPEGNGNGGAKHASTAGWIPCLTCGEKFPDAKAMGIHQTRTHFDNSAAMSRRG